MRWSSFGKVCEPRHTKHAGGKRGKDGHVTCVELTHPLHQACGRLAKPLVAYAALTMFLGMKGNKDFVAPADAFNSVKE